MIRTEEEHNQKLALMKLQLQSHINELAWMQANKIDSTDLQRRMGRLELHIKWL